MSKIEQYRQYLEQQEDNTANGVEYQMATTVHLHKFNEILPVESRPMPIWKRINHGAIPDGRVIAMSPDHTPVDKVIEGYLHKDEDSDTGFICVSAISFHQVSHYILISELLSLDKEP